MEKRVWALILIPFLLFYAIPTGAAEKEDRKWQDEAVYYVMVDRFNNGDNKNDYEVNVQDPKAFHGGDFKGITDKLDYIQDMGFTTIRLNSIFDNEENGYHGKWIQDYYKTEEHYGTIDEFKQLVKEAHKRDMKVIIDFEWNQVGPNHPWRTEPAKKDWFRDENGNLYLNQDNQEVKNYLIDAAKWWIKEANIDGYYLGNADLVSESFIEEFVKEIKGSTDHFYLLGEVKSDDPKTIASFQKMGIDGLIDYPLSESIRPIFDQVDHSLSELVTNKEKLMAIYPEPYLMGSVMDTDEMIRFTHNAVTKNQHPGPRWKLALTYLYTTPGIPIVYYGSEIALEGGEGEANHRQMDFRTDKELIDYITKLGELRGKYPSLTRGSLELLAEENGLSVYKRTYEGETTVIAINNSSESQNITVPSKLLEEDKELRGLLSDDQVKSKDKGYTLFLDREEAEVYILAEKSGLNMPYVIATIVVYGAFLTFIILAWRKSKKKRAQEE
ncbi:alpha-amylase family glycosyl hydrolase [Cytobacillus sp.]|uniref:alpha-amylase family glycosyl hydrolase n=1 Tax=Cytobacillus sp. TaxID=2675269 RepID=UPI0028BE01F1|nr:alpha-amylase family glycosyl hydrolase [Cytobacillus sp.]